MLTVGIKFSKFRVLSVHESNFLFNDLNPMKPLSSFLLLLTFLFASCSQNGSGLKPIFNGKDLSGWTANVDACWKVKNGILHAANDPEQKGDILQTEKSYRNFIVLADFKFGSGRIDTGIFLRDTKEQIQIGESGSLKRDMTALPYIPGKGYPIQVETGTKALKLDDWNTIKVQVTGNTYTTWLNGTQVMTYDSETIIPEGPIGIQVHPKREMSVDFRNILAQELE